MSTVKKCASLAVAIILMLCIFAGCSGESATISTSMKVNKEFSGKRTIAVSVPQSSLSEYVKGGLKALKSTAKANMPKQMTFTTKSTGDGAKLIFTITFKDLDDYCAKVKKIIAAGSDKDLVPEVSYENLDTFFKKGIYFKENFDSSDLLKWYFDALEKSGVVTYSTVSSWYDMGDSAITIGKKKYETDSKMSVDNRELCCLDNLDVETFINYDGSYKRTFSFKTAETRVKELADKGCKLKDYFAKLIAEGDTLTEDVEDTTHTYTITVNAKDAKELVSKTDKLLQTKNDFSVTTQIDEKNPGMAKLTLTEKLDGSYYLNYDGRPLQSTVHMYDNVEFVKDASNELSATLSDDVLQYSPFANSVNKFEFDWKISFETVEIATKIKNTQDVSVDFIFTAAEAMSEELKSAAIGALEQSCGKAGTFSKDENTCTLSFAGTVEEVTKNINAFISFNDSENSDDDYFEIVFAESETGSRLTNGYQGEISYNLKPVIGNTRVLFNDSESFFSDYYYQGNFAIDENGNKTAESSATVSFTLIETSMVALILLGLFILFFLAGIVFVLLNLKNIISGIKQLKEKKKEKAAVVASQESDQALTEDEIPTQIIEESVETIEDVAAFVEAYTEKAQEAAEPQEADLVTTADSVEEQETEEFI